MLNNLHERSVNTHKRKYIRLLNSDDTICVYAQIDGIDGCLFVHVKSDTICTYTQIDGSWATLTLICVSTRSVYVQVDKNNK